MATPWIDFGPEPDPNLAEKKTSFRRAPIRVDATRRDLRVASVSPSTSTIQWGTPDLRHSTLAIFAAAPMSAERFPLAPTDAGRRDGY